MKRDHVCWLFAAALLALSGAAFANAPRPDAGKFLITIQENDIGTTTFTTDADGGSTYDENLNIAGTKVTGHIVITVKKGIPTEADAQYNPGGKLHLVLEGEKSLLMLGATTKPLKLEPRAYLFDNFAPQILTPLLAAYDAKKGGSQKFQLVVVNSGTPLSMTLTKKEEKTRVVSGSPLLVTIYTMTLPGAVGNLDIEVQAGRDNRVLMWNVPAQKYLAVREGYSDLARPEAPADPLLSKPIYTVKKEEKVWVKMRDGVNLAADVYRPDAPGTYPVILQRTPYSRKNAGEAASYVKRGYVFVAQDVRGKFDSEGKWEPFINEAQDGFDSVEWCAAQAWSTGSVGMEGASYLGFVQWAAARENSEHLKCLIPIVSPPDPFFNIPYAYGPLFLYPSLWWAAIVEGKAMQAPKPIRNLDALKTLPLKDVDKKVFGHTVPFFQDWLKHPNNDAYWDQVNFNERMKTMRPIPALHVSGWFDGDGIGTKRNYAAMSAAGQPHQKLVYGPWEHAVNTSSKVGDMDFGPQSLRDLDTLYLRWFDHFLKGVDNGIDREPPVDAFLMGTNEWRSFSAWPPAESMMQKWYFHSGGKANGSGGDGKLSPEIAITSEPADRYDYNPAKPFIPAAFLALAKGGKEDATPDFAADEKAKDKLVYTSDVLTQNIAVAGPLSVHLTAATSAKDTDWYAYINDIDDKGKSRNLTQGIIRARFRKSFSAPELLTPGETAEYDLDLWAIGNVFQKGHRIRVVVTSSCFPVYDRNLNTGEDAATATRMVTAHQQIFHDTARASYLLLPVLPK